MPQQNRQAITFKGFARRVDNARFELLRDRRKAKGKRYSHRGLVSALALGLIAGCESLRSVETLSSKLSRQVRRRCEIPKRLSDTTLRSEILRLKEWELRRCLHRQVKAEHRRGNLKPNEFPMGIVAIDGKCLAKTNSWDHRNILKCQPQTGVPYGLARVHRSFLVSTPVCVCIDQNPIPGDTNELGTILETVKNLHQIYAHTDIMGAFIADAGNSSSELANWAHAHHYGYILALKMPQGMVTSDAVYRLKTAEVEETSSERKGGKLVTHRLRRVHLRDESPWSSARQYIEVERTTLNLSTGETTTGSRIYVSNIPFAKLSPKQCLKAIRAYWRCENEGHGTVDRIWTEDRKRTPWSQDPEAIFALGALRMLALNVLAVLRVQTRAPQLGATLLPWKECFRDAYVALIAMPQHADD